MSKNRQIRDAGCTKARVTVAEMARMVRLSRSRFYQLMGTTFPRPSYDSKTGRPFYTEELQAICLGVRRSNCGADGKAVAFYAQRRKSTRSKATFKQESEGKKPHIIELMNGLKSLGLKTVKVGEVEAVIREAYPNGTAGIDPDALLQRVFVELKHNKKG
jgi:hypothetical protein